MKTKPLVFSLQTMFYLAVAAGLPLQLIAIYEHDFSSYQVILNQITPWNWLVICMMLFNAYLSHEGHHLLKISLPLSLVVVAFNNAQASIDGEDFGNFLPWVSTAFYGGLILAFSTSKAYQKIIMNQSLRWWKSDPRFKSNLMVLIGTRDCENLAGLAVDVSRTGIFLSFPDTADQRWNRLLEGDTVRMYFRIKGEGAVNCQARVVRKTKNSNGHYPHGIGFKLENFTGKGKRSWWGFIADLAHSKEVPMHSNAA